MGGSTVSSLVAVGTEEWEGRPKNRVAIPGGLWAFYSLRFRAKAGNWAYPASCQKDLGDCFLQRIQLATDVRLGPKAKKDRGCAFIIHGAVLD